MGNLLGVNELLSFSGFLSFCSAKFQGKGLDHGLLPRTMEVRAPLLTVSVDFKQ